MYTFYVIFKKKGNFVKSVMVDELNISCHLVVVVTSKYKLWTVTIIVKIFQLVEEFLKNRLPVNTQDKADNTALHYACHSGNIQALR